MLNYTLKLPNIGEKNVTKLKNVYVFRYPCNSNYLTCSPYEITFKPGKYRIELWGA